LAAVWWPEARTGDLVAYLDDQELARLIALTEVAEAGAGDFLLHKGSPSRSVLLVEDGQIEIIDETLGETIVLGRVGPGGVVGEVGFLDGQPRTHHVRAGTGLPRAAADTGRALGAGPGRSPALREGLRRPGRPGSAAVPQRARGARPAARVRGVAGRPRGQRGGRGEAALATEPKERATSEDAADDGPIHYDEIEDPILDQALDVLRELARRPGKDLAGV
jgi:hypothetical protein